MSNITVACLQLTSTDDMQHNISQLSALTQQAAGQGATLITTPENTFLMEAPGAARTLYSESDHPGLAAARALAKTHAIWLLIGSAAIKVDESGKTMNRSYLLNSEGNIAAHYDKIHLFDAQLPNGEHYAESARFLAGDKAVIAHTPFAAIGMTICYDLRFPHLYRSLAHSGAQLLSIPAAFTHTTGQAHWHVLLRARAIENGCYVIAPAQTGTHPGGRKTFGHSLIINPWGEILADAGNETGIITADLDLNTIPHTRQKLPSLKHTRDFGLNHTKKAKD